MIKPLTKSLLFIHFLFSTPFYTLFEFNRYYMLAGSLICEQDWHKLLKTSSTTNASTAPVRKGKVGRPRRSRD